MTDAEILQHYRETDAEMRSIAHEIFSRRCQIEKLEREIEPLQQRLNLLVRLPRESHGKWSKVP